MTNDSIDNKKVDDRSVSYIELDPLGSLLRDARRKKNLTRLELAKATEIGVNSIVKYELAGIKGGTFPPLPKLAKLAAFLQLDGNMLLAATAEDEADKNFLLYEVSQILIKEGQKAFLMAMRQPDALETMRKAFDNVIDNLEEKEPGKV